MIRDSGDVRLSRYLPFWPPPLGLVADGAGGGGLAPCGMGIFSVVCGMLLSFAIRRMLPGLDEVIQRPSSGSFRPILTYDLFPSGLAADGAGGGGFAPGGMGILIVVVGTLPLLMLCSLPGSVFLSVIQCPRLVCDLEIGGGVSLG